MAESITTSIRLSKEMDNELRKAAKAEHHGKNWIIVQAIREYLAKRKEELLYKQARSESLMIAEREAKYGVEDLGDLADDTGWEWKDD